MGVYVDDVNIPASVPNGNRVHTSQWCHLMADTLPELLAFADKIGLRRSWLQDKRSGVHFDFTAGKRRQAVAAGAVEIEAASPEWMRVIGCAKAQWSGRTAARGEQP